MKRFFTEEDFETLGSPHPLSGSLSPNQSVLARFCNTKVQPLIDKIEQLESEANPYNLANGGKIEQMRLRIAELEKALEFYASDEAWGAGEPIWRRPPIYKDAGSKARKILDQE
jgi:hypothetical protein